MSVGLTDRKPCVTRSVRIVMQCHHISPKIGWVLWSWISHRYDKPNLQFIHFSLIQDKNCNIDYSCSVHYIYTCRPYYNKPATLIYKTTGWIYLRRLRYYSNGTLKLCICQLATILSFHIEGFTLWTVYQLPVASYCFSSLRCTSKSDIEVQKQ